MDELKKFSKRLNDLSSVLNPVNVIRMAGSRDRHNPWGRTDLCGRESGAKEWPWHAPLSPTPCSLQLVLLVIAAVSCDSQGQYHRTGGTSCINKANADQTGLLAANAEISHPSTWYLLNANRGLSDRRSLLTSA